MNTSEPFNKRRSYRKLGSCNIMNNSDFFQVGKYKISHLCLQSYPCQHYIKTDYKSEPVRCYGTDIYLMLKNNNLSHSHFDEYAEVIRKRDNPTAEELIEQANREQDIKKAEEERHKIQKEQDYVTNMYKASSYLDKLKAKNESKQNKAI